MTNVQMVILILIFIVTALWAYTTGKQAGRRELSKQIAETLTKGIQEVSAAFEKYAESLKGENHE